ncbi:UNVERIFIED_CONTAM: hypothetical protein Scaly_0195500 [Sesamum calycinum]|uniref:EF-hand domain-containing protein n=1 Tax=Sesamum calycinum TaxID=2727403 RepID=A0AAW2T108_9LAMI
MGQILEKVQGKEWKERQIQMISNKIFNRVKSDTGRTNLTFEELYIAVLLVYNDLNKRLPGPHFDPPSKEEIKNLMQESDINLDGELDREEFVKFIRRLTKDTFFTVSQGLILTLAVAPTVALLTKRTTENVPGVGKVVQKIPNSVYASLVTLVIVAFQQGAESAGARPGQLRPGAHRRQKGRDDRCTPEADRPAQPKGRNLNDASPARGPCDPSSYPLEMMAKSQNRRRSCACPSSVPVASPAPTSPARMPAKPPAVVPDRRPQQADVVTPDRPSAGHDRPKHPGAPSARARRHGAAQRARPHSHKVPAES